MTLTLGRKFYNFLILVSLLLTTTICLGQADPNDPTSPNYKGKTSAVQRQKYTATISSTFGRGINEFSESFGAYSFSGGYNLKKSSLTMNVDYRHPLDGDTDDTRQWRFDDVEMIWNAPALKPREVGGQKINFLPRLIYRAPVSETSQYASSYGSLIGTLVSMTNYGRFSFILTPQLHMSYHEFETADVAGFTNNVPLALAMSATVRMMVIKNLFITGSTFYYQGYDYDFGSQPTNGLSGNIFYQATPKLGLVAYTSWRDRVYSNNSLFASETSAMGFGLLTTF